MNRIKLKRRSREQLGNHIFNNTWLMSVVGVLILSAIQSFAASVPVLPLFLIGPLGVGLVIFFKNIIRTSSVRIETLFQGFLTDFKGSLLIGLMSTIFVALWSLLFIIPGIVKGYAYSMAYYLKSEHEDWDWRKCLDESTKLTNGHKFDLFILDLSFIGWYIVGSLCFGIGSLWVTSYHEMTKINFFEEITLTRVE